MTTPAPYPPVDGTQPCTRVDPEIFFPRRGGVEAVEQALAVCRHCPFREPCAAYALTHDVRGVWGGLTAQTRRQVQKRHGIHPIPTCRADDEVLADDDEPIEGTPA